MSGTVDLRYRLIENRVLQLWLTVDLGWKLKHNMGERLVTKLLNRSIAIYI